jgi:membrane associated rhomboid family serine protease
MPTRRVPVVNYLLIAANILVFVMQWLAGPQQEALVYQFALIPAQLTSALDPGDIGDIFTSMFMHAGLMHLAGNMLYLWIFGDNVEDSMGPLKYLAFYLAGGVVASLAHIFTNPTSQIPTVGASGAIAAVLGAYLVLFPRSRVLTIIPLGFYMRLTMVPAALVLGLWFVLQIFSGVLALGGPDVGGVAFWAHVGGFVTGVVLGLLLAGQRKTENVRRW